MAFSLEGSREELKISAVAGAIIGHLVAWVDVIGIAGSKQINYAMCVSF